MSDVLEELEHNCSQMLEDDHLFCRAHARMTRLEALLLAALYHDEGRGDEMIFSLRVRWNENARNELGLSRDEVLPPGVMAR